MSFNTVHTFNPDALTVLCHLAARLLENCGPQNRVPARNIAQLTGARRVTQPVMEVPCLLRLSLPRKADAHPPPYLFFLQCHFLNIRAGKQSL